MDQVANRNMRVEDPQRPNYRSVEIPLLLALTFLIYVVICTNFGIHAHLSKEQSALV